MADLLADAAAGVDATYRVAYEIGTATVEVAQRPPDRRVEVTAADGTVDATFALDGTSYSCTDPPGDDPWRCATLGDPATGGAFDEAAVAELAGALADGARDYDFTVSSRRLAGTEARCLVTERRPGATGADLGDRAELCVAPSGALLLVERAQGAVRAVEYADDVDDDAFELPADPDPAGRPG